MRSFTNIVRGHGVALLLGLVGSILCWPAPAQAGTVPPGFQESTAFSGLTNPTAITFGPDGRVFVGEKSGLIKVFDGLGDSSATTVADLRTETHNFWDRGLLGLTIDPQFPTRPYLYALYTLDAEPGGAVPRWGTAGQSADPCPTPPGPTGDGCVVTGRLTRLTISGDTMSAKTNLITDWCQQYPSHSIGDLAFGPDGSLYVTGGDGASFNFTDWGQDGNPVNPCGDPPGGIGGAMTPPTAQGGALRSQDARTTADPTSLDGTLLRVDPDTGAGLPGNPFAGSADENQRRIAALGFRNPFRFTVRPGTEEVWIGDVGWGAWEEVNRVIDPSDTGADNLGWPCYEGSGRQGGYDGANLDLCENLYAQGGSAVVPPYYAYNHSAKVVSGESCPTGSSAIAGLRFYESGPFPNSYNGALFFADNTRDCIWAMLPGGNGLPNPATIQTFDAGASNPVDLEIHQGELFYANFDGGTIQRVRSTVNQSPTAVATATPSAGPAPLSVQLSASGSSDPDDAFATLAFAWDADDDGSFDDGNGVTLNRTYQAGTHTATVRVTDPGGESDTDSVTIQTDNTAPLAQINAPTGSTTWAVDDLVAFSGSATDAEQSLPASAFDWELVIDHCPSNCHTHVAEEFPDRTSGSFFAPDHEYPSTLTIKLTVTDAGGLSDTESVTIDPRTVSLTLDSAPDGILLGLNSASPAAAPFTRTVIEGSQNTVIASSPQTLGGQTYEFGSWSDGGGASHNVTVDEDTTLVATFDDVTAPVAPTITDTDPDSPANDNNPEVKGAAGAGSPTIVKLYTNASCSGGPAATGTPAQFAAGGITVGVASDATTQLTALNADAAGNESGCSPAFEYIEDSTAPPAPEITDTDPDSPANDNDPAVRGTAGPDSTVRLYESDDCSGPIAAGGSAAQFAGSGLTASVPDDSTTDFTALAVDGVNASACSDPFPYREDSTGPDTAIVGGPAARVKMPVTRRTDRVERPKGAAVTFSFVAGEPVYGFACSLDGGAFAPCASPLELAGLKRGPHSFEVWATDKAGNPDATPAVRKFKVVKKKRKKR